MNANQVTLLAAALSVALGLVLAAHPQRTSLFLCLPLLLFVRMALNAIDGMLAREFGQKSALGAYLNELCELLFGAFLYLPFAFLPHFSPRWVGAVIVLAVISEMAGTVAVMTGAGRRHGVRHHPHGVPGRAGFGVLLGAGAFSPYAVFLGLGRNRGSEGAPQSAGRGDCLICPGGCTRNQGHPHHAGGIPAAPGLSPRIRRQGGRGWTESLDLTVVRNRQEQRS